MLSPRILAIVAHVILGLSFAIGNIWFAASRSTIPLEVRGTVTQKQRLIEKTPGVDDVYLISLDENRRIQVDEALYNEIARNQLVDKQAWSKVVDVDGKEVDLNWSADCRGMIWAMPLTISVCFLLAFIAIRKARQETEASTEID